MNPADRTGSGLGYENQQREYGEPDDDPDAPDLCPEQRSWLCRPINTMCIASQPAQCEPVCRQQQQRVKVGVNSEDANQDIADAISARRGAKQRNQEARRERRQQQEEGVAASLLRVANAIRIEGQQSACDQRDASVIQLPGQPVNCRDRRNGDQHGEAADEKLALALGGSSRSHIRSSR